MAGRNEKDVALVIRARDEASKTFDAVADALHQLVNETTGLGATSSQTESKLGSLAKVLLSVDKAAADIGSKFDSAAEASNRMRERAAANAAEFDALTIEAQSLAAVVEILASESDKAFIGPKRNGLSATFNAAKSDLAGLQSQINKVGASISRDLAGAGGSTSSLQQIASTQIAIGEASATARAQIELETRALQEQVAAGQQVTAMQQRINAATGVNRPAAFNGQSASQSANLLVGADDAYSARQAAALRDAGIAYKLFQERVKQGAVEMAEAEAAAESAFLRDAAIAHKQFEARVKQGSAEMAAAETASLTAAADAHKMFEARVRQGVAEMNAAERAAKGEADAIANLKAQINPVGAAMAYEIEQLKILTQWQRDGKITTEELAAAKKLLAQATKNAAQSEGNRPQVSLFGLRPYETQNLMYQFNDIATQLSSGTSLSQTLAQQGGQIFQLFQNRIGPAIVSVFSNPYFLGGAAVVAGFALGVDEAANKMERLRTLSGDLAANVDGGLYDPKQLDAVTRALDHYGMSATDALAAVRALSRDGVAPDRLEQFAKAAKDLADVTGTDLKDAVKQVGTAFTGGFDQIDRYDKSLNFLTGTQRAYILTLFEQGRADDARAYAFDRFAERQEAGAEKMRGPWTDAARALGNAYSAMIKAIGDTDTITQLTHAWDDLGKSITTVLNRLSGNRGANDIANDIANVQGQIARIKAGTEPQRLDGAAIPQATRLQMANQLLAQLQKEARDLAAKQPASGANGGTGSATTAGGSQAAVKAQERLGELQDEAIVNNRTVSDELRKQAALRIANLKIQHDLSEEGMAKASQATRDGYQALQLAQATAAIDKRLNDDRRERASVRDAEIAKFSGRVIGAEGGPGKNPNPGTASGFGQFTNATWLDQFKKLYGDTGKSDSEILDLKNNKTIAQGVIEQYAKANATFLEGFGQQVTAGNLYLVHFLGQGGARKLLSADPNTSTQDLFKNDKGVLSGNQSYFRKDSGKGAYRTAGELKGFMADKMGDAGTQQSAGMAEIAKLQQDAADTQEKFNQGLDAENTKRLQSIANLTSEQGLRDTALIALKREAAINDAIAKAQADRIKTNEELARKNEKPLDAITPAQLAAIRQTTGAYYDLAQAKAKYAAQLDEVQRPLTDYTAQRDALVGQRDALSAKGDFAAADGLNTQISNLEGQIDAAIAKVQALYAAFADNPDALAALGLTKEGVAAIETRLKTTSQRTKDLGTVMGVDLNNAARTFASGATKAISGFIGAVAAGRNVFSSLKDAFLTFAATFLQQIAEMIIQAIEFRLISSFLGGFGGGVGSTSSAVSAMAALHDGGIAGAPGGLVRGGINPAVFNGAIRMHTGGIAGLGPNEVPRILERDEEVLTRSDVRHVMNGGKNGKSGSSAPQQDIKIVNAFDHGDVLSKAMETRVGQKAVLNFVSSNQEAFKQAMGTM